MTDVGRDKRVLRGEDNPIKIDDVLTQLAKIKYLVEITVEVLFAARPKPCWPTLDFPMRFYGRR